MGLPQALDKPHHYGGQMADFEPELTGGNVEGVVEHQHNGRDGDDLAETLAQEFTKQVKARMTTTIAATSSTR